MNINKSKRIRSYYNGSIYGQKEQRTGLYEENIKGIKESCFLGSQITYDLRSKKEIKSRIDQTKMGFNSKNRKMLLMRYGALRCMHVKHDDWRTREKVK